MAATVQDATRGRESASTPEKNAKSLQNHANITEAVAKLLHPNIVAAVTQALNQELAGIKHALEDHSKNFQEAEQHISTLENKISITQGNLHDMAQTNQDLREKLDDIENRSRRNNLRIVGLPENYKSQRLLDLCQFALLKLFKWMVYAWWKEPTD